MKETNRLLWFRVIRDRWRMKKETLMRGKAGVGEGQKRIGEWVEEKGGGDTPCFHLSVKTKVGGKRVCWGEAKTGPEGETGRGREKGRKRQDIEERGGRRRAYEEKILKDIYVKEKQVAHREESISRTVEGGILKKRKGGGEGKKLGGGTKEKP